jgi:hypothetical protein
MNRLHIRGGGGNRPVISTLGGHATTHLGCAAERGGEVLGGCRHGKTSVTPPAGGFAANDRGTWATQRGWIITYWAYLTGRGRIQISTNIKIVDSLKKKRSSMYTEKKIKICIEVET